MHRWLGFVSLVVVFGAGCKKDEPASAKTAETPSSADDAAPQVPTSGDDAGAEAKRGDGPGAGIADFGFAPDGQPNDDGSQPYEVSLRIHLDHSLGYVRAPVLEVEARSGGAQVARSRVTEGEGLVYEHSIELPVPGRWSIDLYADGKYVDSVGAELKRLTCAGGVRDWDFTSLESGQAPPDADFAGLDAGIGSGDYFRLSSSRSERAVGDQPAAAIAEWVRGDQVVFRQVLESDHIESAFEALDELGSRSRPLCAQEADAHFEVAVPKEKMAAMVPGKWKLRTHVSGAKSLETSFELTGKEEDQAGQEEEGWITVPGKEREIPTPDAIKKELDAKVAAIESSAEFKARVPELRAVMRNRAAFEARVALTEAKKNGDPAASASAEQNLAKLVAEHGAKPFAKTSAVTMAAPKKLETAAPAPPPGSGCDHSRCSSYPALSEDGKFVVHRTEMCLYVETGDGGQGEITRHYQLADSEEVPSRDLSGYRPLECGKTGFKAVERAGKHSLVGKGKKTIDLGEEPEKEVAAICAHPEDKTLLVVWHRNMLEGLTGEPLCVEGSSFQQVSY